MRLVLDTNVFISGVFFSGPPYEILDGWRRGAVDIVLSTEILHEYRETAAELSRQFSEVDLTPWLELLTVKATIVEAPALPQQVCTDPDDDMFLACALASRTKLIVSGDKALRRTSGYRGIHVVTPREFVERYLRKISPPRDTGGTRP